MLAGNQLNDKALKDVCIWGLRSPQLDSAEGFCSDYSSQGPRQVEDSYLKTQLPLWRSHGVKVFRQSNRPNYWTYKSGSQPTKTQVVATTSQSAHVTASSQTLDSTTPMDGSQGLKLTPFTIARKLDTLHQTAWNLGNSAPKNVLRGTSQILSPKP